MRLICHLELRRKEVSGLDFKEKLGNSQVYQKEQTCGKQILAILPRHGGESKKQTFLGSTLSVTLRSYL